MKEYTIQFSDNARLKYAITDIELEHVILPLSDLIKWHIQRHGRDHHGAIVFEDIMIEDRPTRIKLMIL